MQFSLFDVSVNAARGVGCKRRHTRFCNAGVTLLSKIGRFISLCRKLLKKKKICWISRLD
jgi:hypothetical protein